MSTPPLTDPSTEFAGHSALVTGAASGIGLATARRLGAGGAQVVIADFNAEGAEKAAAELTAEGLSAAAVEVDVTRPESVEAAVEFAVDTFGGLDLAVNNAGIGGPSAPTGVYDIAAYDRVVRTNLDGVFYSMRYELPAIEAGGKGGAIVNVASILGSVAFAGSPAYVAAKHGPVAAQAGARLDRGRHRHRRARPCGDPAAADAHARPGDRPGRERGQAASRA